MEIDLSKVNEEYFKAMKLRGELLKNPKFKMCFECQHVKHIDDFDVNTKKFQLASGKGKVITCKECLTKRK